MAIHQITTAANPAKKTSRRRGRDHSSAHIANAAKAIAAAIRSQGQGKLEK